MSRAVWQKQAMDEIDQLANMGYAVSDVDVEKALRQAAYAENVFGATLAQQVTYLKTEFGRVLLDEESFSTTDYQNRLEALLDMLKRSGTEVSRSAQNILSGSRSLAGSPDRPGAEEPGGRGLAVSESGCRGLAAPTVKALGAGPPPLLKGRGPTGGVPFVASSSPKGFGAAPTGREGHYASCDPGLATAIHVQTAVTAKALSSRDTRHSTIKVSPTVK
jgi:hypothetical protein